MSCYFCYFITCFCIIYQWPSCWGWLWEKQFIFLVLYSCTLSSLFFIYFVISINLRLPVSIIVMERDKIIQLHVHIGNKVMKIKQYDPGCERISGIGQVVILVLCSGVVLFFPTEGNSRNLVTAVSLMRTD